MGLALGLEPAEEGEDLSGLGGADALGLEVDGEEEVSAGRGDPDWTEQLHHTRWHL